MAIIYAIQERIILIVVVLLFAAVPYTVRYKSPARPPTPVSITIWCYPYYPTPWRFLIPCFPTTDVYFPSGATIHGPSCCLSCTHGVSHFVFTRVWSRG